MAFLPRRGCSSSDRDSDTAPLQRRTGSRGPHREARPEGRTLRLGLLSWGSSIPLRRHDCRLRPLPPEPSLRLRSGTTTSRTRSVLAVPPGFNGFLRRERVRGPALRLPAGLLHPAAGRGVHQVSDSRSAFRLSAARRPSTRRPDGIIPCGEYPSKRFPPRQPSTKPSPRVLLSDSAAFTSWRAFSSFVARPLPCCHGALHAQPTSRLCSTEESVADDAAFPLRTARCSHGLLSRHVPMLPRGWAPSRQAGRFASRANPRGVPGPEQSWGRQSVSALSGSMRPMFDRIPEGSERNRSRVALVHPEGSNSAASRRTPRGSWDADGSTPKGGSTPSAPWHPKALGLRRIASRPRRDSPRPSAHPEGQRRWFELVLPSLARSPAHLWRACSPPTSDARRRGHPRATRARVPKDAASSPSVGPPKESQRKGESSGHPKVIR